MYNYNRLARRPRRALSEGRLNRVRYMNEDSRRKINVVHWSLVDWTSFYHDIVMPYAELYYDEKTGRYSLPERLVHIPFKKYLDWMFNRRGRLADTKIVNSPEAIKMTNQLVEDLDSLKALVNRVTDAGDPKKTERLLKEYEHFFRTVGACVS